MKIIHIMLVGLLLVTGSCSDDASLAQEVATSSPASWDYLAPDQLQIMRRKGQSGDKEAAFRVYLHYEFAENGSDRAQEWLNLAAEAGHKLAMQHLAAYQERAEQAAAEAPSDQKSWNH